MHDFLDIYTKLIIAIASFIAPVIFYLLSVNTDGIGIVREKAIEESNQLNEIINNQENQKNKNKETGYVFDNIIKESNKALKKVNNRIKRKSNLLTPKRQIYRIFSSLFCAILFLMCRMLAKESIIFPNNHTLCVTFLILSFASTITSILILRQITWVVIETKEEVAKKGREQEKSSAEEIVIATDDNN